MIVRHSAKVLSKASQILYGIELRTAPNNGIYAPGGISYAKLKIVPTNYVKTEYEKHLSNDVVCK